MMPIEVDPLARAEIRRARRYLARHSSPSTAGRFALAVDEAVNRLATRPLSFAVGLHGTRLCPVRRFQYHIVFLAEPSRVFVVAVSHNHRRPGYWVRRLPRP